MSNINIGYASTGNTIIGTTLGTNTGSSQPSNIYASEDYLHKCQQVRDLISSITAFYQILHDGTEEENLLALQMFSKKFERINKIINEAIDLIENKKSVNLT